MYKLSIHPMCSISLDIFWSFSLYKYTAISMIIRLKDADQPKAAEPKVHKFGLFELIWHSNTVD